MTYIFESVYKNAVYETVYMSENFDEIEIDGKKYHISWRNDAYATTLDNYSEITYWADNGKIEIDDDQIIIIMYWEETNPDAESAEDKCDWESPKYIEINETLMFCRNN